MIFLNKFIYLFIYFWLHWVFVAAWAFTSCSEQGLLFIVVRGLLIEVASRCRAWALGVRASVVVTCGLSSCGSRAIVCRLSSSGVQAYRNNQNKDYKNSTTRTPWRWRGQAGCRRVRHRSQRIVLQQIFELRPCSLPCCC